jgi:hypothetical protein
MARSSWDKSRRPKFLTCGTGMLVGIISSFIIGLLVLLAPTLATNVVLFIPDRLGLVAHVSQAEVTRIWLPGEHYIELSRSGDYIIYCDSAMSPAYEITLESKATGEQIVALPTSDYVLRDDGYFHPLAEPYAPIYEFRVAQPGAYILTAEYFGRQSGPSSVLTVVPAVSAHNDIVCVLSILIQGAVTVLVVWTVYRRLSRAGREADEEARRVQRERREAWMGGAKK